MIEWQVRRRRVLLFGGVLLLVATVCAVATASTHGSEAGTVSLYATDEGEFEDASGIEAAIEEGTLEPAEDVVVGETLVVGVDSERLAADLSARTGPTTERFFGALEDGANVTLVQTNAGPNRAPKVLALDADSTRVYRNGTTTYLEIDTDVVEPGIYPPWEDSERDIAIHGGETFAVIAGYGTNDQPTGPSVTFHRVEAEFFDARAVVAPEVVNGTVKTHLEPERSVTVRATLEDGSTIATRLQPERSSVTQYSLDLREAPPGTNYTLELIHDGDVVDRREGTVRKPEAALWAAEVTAVEDNNHDARLDVTAELSHGGEVVVRDGFGARVGSRRAPPGHTVELSMGLRFGGDAASEPDPDTLQVQAVRGEDRVEQRYPSTNATLTLDVSEYEWETTDWTRPSDPDDGVGSSPDDEGTVDNGTARGESAGEGTSGGSNTGDEQADDGATGGDSSDESLSGVGGGPTDTGSRPDGLGAATVIVGVVTVLGTTGYLLTRRGAGR